MSTLTTILLNYNHARFLPHSLASLLAQTRRANELIIIDDASTDNSIEVISDFLPKFPNAELVPNPVNQGTVANMNDGLRLGQGTYVHFAAADDVFYPQLYEIGLTVLAANPAAALFSSRSDVIDETDRNLKLSMPSAGYPLRAPGFISPAQAQRFLMRHDGWFMGNTALFCRAKVLEEGGFPPELQSFADGYVCRLLALKYGSCFSPDVLAAWRRLEDGFSSSINRSPEKSSAFIASAEQRMLANGAVFPPGYVRRWKGRQQFGIRRQALARECDQRTVDGTARRLFRELNRKIQTGFLFLKLRPRDLIAKCLQCVTSYRR